MTKFINDLSKEVYEDNYKAESDKTVDDSLRRVAKDLAKIEKDPDYWEEKFFEVLADFKTSVGGRILSNAGLGYKSTTYINCFVDGFQGKDQDSMDSIMDALKRQAQILRSEGGYGFCVDILRPTSEFIEGIGNQSPGPVAMLEMWDKQANVITRGGKKKNKKGKKKIRKGAQMVTMSIWHPSIEEFITAKLKTGMLEHFNMSVLITDDFMQAVKKNKPWSLEFPDFHSSKEVKKKYESTWDGNIEKWKKEGLPVKIYKTYEDANELWDLIMESTYNRAEPGVIFIDKANHFNNLHYNEHINATNPCGEQLLPVGGVCLLGSVNLVHFVKGNNWDYEKLEELIPVFNRMLDNVNDVTDVPLKSQKDNLKNKRRIGVGYMGYASALMMMKVAYGSKKALRMTDELASFFVNKLYQSSAMLAKEKGAFPLFDKKKYLESNFVKKLWPETIELIKKYGIRNSHLTSIQPTGNTSILCNIVSGGLEPIFAAEYTRTSIVTTPPEGLYIPEVDFAGKSFKLPADSKQVWEWKSEGGDPILVTEFEGTTYKVDISRGLVKESVVRDFAVEYLSQKEQWDANAEWAKGAMSLSVKEHVDTMKVFAKYVDSAMSKTINIPNDYPYEDFKKVYMDCFDSGVIKGCTTYRTGTRTAVLSTSEDKKESLKADTMKRPEELECDLFQLSAEGKKWFVIVGLLDKRPYEVFSFPVDSMLFTVPTDIKKGRLVKRKVKGKKVYDLHVGKWILPDVISNFETHEQESLTRMTSMTLRHGADVKYVVDQLLKSSGTVVSFNKAIARVLKSYIDDIEGLKCLDCGSSNVQMTEGCITCRDCGSSKCS